MGTHNHFTCVSFITVKFVVFTVGIKVKAGLDASKNDKVNYCNTKKITLQEILNAWIVINIIQVK
jgi:hypothetical protein